MKKIENNINEIDQLEISDNSSSRGSANALLTEYQTGCEHHNPRYII